jgi:hypothetical protein
MGNRAVTVFSEKTKAAQLVNEVRRWSLKIADEFAARQTDPEVQDRAKHFALCRAGFIRDAFGAQRARSAVLDDLAAQYAAGAPPSMSLDDHRLAVAMLVFDRVEGKGKKRHAFAFTMSASPNRMKTDFEASQPPESSATWVLQYFADMLARRAHREAKAAKSTCSEKVAIATSAQKAIGASLAPAKPGPVQIGPERP